MENTVLLEIQALEGTLSERIKLLRGSDEEESKEQARLKKRVNEVGEAIRELAERVKETLLKKVKTSSDPVSQLSRQIE